VYVYFWILLHTVVNNRLKRREQRKYIVVLNSKLSKILRRIFLEDKSRKLNSTKVFGKSLATGALPNEAFTFFKPQLEYIKFLKFRTLVTVV
jgi:hypothetical protein